MKQNTLLKKAFLGFLCTGIAGAFSVTAWAQQPTVTVTGGTVVVPGAGGDVFLNKVGNGGVVTMPDPGSGSFTIDPDGTNLLTWTLLGDLSFASNSLDQSTTPTTSATPIYSFNKNPRQSEQPSNLARSKGRVYISYAATCSGGISFDILKEYDDSDLPIIIGPECWLPDSTYTYSVDQIASDNLSDGIGIDKYYWTIKDKDGLLVYDSEDDAIPPTYPDSYTSADRSSITTKVPNPLESPYTITCCFGRANPWDGDGVHTSLPTHTSCVTKIIGANPIPPSLIIADKCLDVLTSSFTVGVSSFNPSYTYNWSSNNSQWLITPNPAGGATVTGTDLTGGGIISLEVENGGCSSSIVRDTVNRTFSDTVSIVGDTCVSSGSTHNYQLRPSEVQANLTGWTLPYGWTYNTVNGTHSDINITIPGGTPGGTYTIKAYASPCDEDTVYLTVRVRPQDPQKVSGEECINHGSTATETYTVSPPGFYQWTIPAGWTGSSTNETITVTPSGNTFGQVIAIGRDTSGMGCNSLNSAVWNINFNPIAPDTINPVTCWNFGYDAENVITVQNAPNNPFFGTYTVTSSPTGLFNSYDVDQNTGEITLNTLGSAPAGTYILTITHSVGGGACPSQSNTNIPINFEGNGASFSNFIGTSNCDYYFGPPNTTNWLVNDQSVTPDGSTVTILGGTLILCGTGTPPLSVCAEVTTGGCTTRVCSDTLGTHSAIAIYAGGTASLENVSSRDLINVYPNPNNGNFTVEVPVFENTAVLEMYDISGRLVRTRKLEQGSNAVNENLTTGTYILLFKVDGAQSVRKIEISQ